MAKSRKLSIFIFSLMLVLASLIFASCGKLDYSKTRLSSSVGDFVELFVDDEKEIEITIQNPVDEMNRGINFTQSNPYVAQISRVANQNNSTIYSILGLSGGRTTVDFVSVEGRKSLSVTIYVKEFSDTLSKGDNNLYVSKSSELQPTSSDFKFKESATERNLEYYFYGQNTVVGSLTADDINSSNGYINNFTKVSIYSTDGNDYLIFTDKDGLLHTLGKGTLAVGTNNIRYDFIDANKTENGYEFDFDEATAVDAGSKFSFLAKYTNDKLIESGDNGTIFCEREFSILNDIQKEDFTHEYGYKINEISYVAGRDESSYKVENLKNGKITLIPNYTSTIMDNPFLAGNTANYLTAYLEIETKTNEQLNYNFNIKDNNIANSKLIDTLKVGDKTIYYIEVNCGIGTANSTSMDLNFYYTGFENSEDEKVNFTYSIPIEIRIIPTSLLINNVDFALMNKVYKFYNSYASADSGWQTFNFSVIPDGAEYDSLTIDLTDTNLQIKYLNRIYTTGNVEIVDLKEPVYIKGAENAELSTQIQNIPVSMDFNIIQQDSLKTNIQYEIVRGATNLSFENEEFKKAIYLERNSGQILFNYIFADAEFTNMSFSLDSGKDVVRFSYDTEKIYSIEGARYYLNIELLPIDIGSGTYTISLDNGVQTTITIDVREALQSLSLSTTNEDNSVKFKEDSENNTLIYLLNKNGNSYFDANMIANGDRNSTAITNIDVIINSNSSISLRVEEGGRYLLYSPKSGSEEVIFKVQGYQIENFVRSTINIDYIVDLVTYELAEDIYVYKLSDGYSSQYSENTSANYVNVYSNTYNNELREAKLEVALKNPNAFLFQSQHQDSMRREFVASSYSQEFLYFESDTVIFKNGQNVDRMFWSSSQDNIYTIGNFGTFDTERLVFSSYSSVANSGRIKLLAHVMQYNKLYSFTININIEVYQEVERITLQNTLDELEFSVLNKESSIIAYPTNANATNGEIVALISGGQIKDDNGNTYQMLNENSLSYIVSDGKTQILFRVNEDFVNAASNYQEEMTGEIRIAAKDWLDVSGNIRSGYSEYVITLPFRFANGTLSNRFTIQDSNDLLAMRDNLSAHYRIKTTIDASNINNLLPLGQLKGSIIGTNEYAGISGLSISNGIRNNDGHDYYGLFSSIAEDAFIEYVQFSGNFNIKAEYSSNIGIIAGENRGRLINVGASITTSNIELLEGAGESSFGGLVGINYGDIIQDFTLFEDEESSLTRSESLKNLIEQGRISYSRKSPRITVLMSGFVNINYQAVAKTSSTNETFDRYFGGVVGLNLGLIKKVDSKILTFSGYNNYFAYSMLKTGYSNTLPSNLNLRIFVGGLVGQNGTINQSSGDTISQEGIIVGGYNNNETSVKDNVNYVIYNEYKFKSEIDGNEIEIGNFEAGNGLMVGGEVWGYGFVGGIAGRIVNITDSKQLTGITSRCFIRGLMGNTVANATLIGYVEQIRNSASLSNAFGIQAVDDGRVLEESAMVVLYGPEIPAGLISVDSITGKKTLLINKLGFGNKDHRIDALNMEEIPNASINVYSYVNRNYIEGDNVAVINTNRTYFYGDFVVVGESGSQGQKIVVSQFKFAPGELKNLSVDEKFNNKMISTTGNSDIFYCYYFQAASTVDNDVTALQASINSELNRLDITSKIYPFIANGEMTFTSKSADILTIDQMGKITIKNTGLAQITASSVLNSNESLSFYIYVVNYFNSQSMSEEKSSIIYPTSSSSSVALDETTIELRGNNSATIYVIPNYEFNDSSLINFKSDARGYASFKNVYFYLAQNTEVSADVKVVKNTFTEDIQDENGDVIKVDIDEFYSEDENPLEISVVGQLITFRRYDYTEEGNYKLRIIPMLKVNLNKEEYYSETNKTLDRVVVDYKYGAIEINNKNYNNVPIQTSKIIIDEITIISTDKNEKEPLYYILGLKDQPLQGNIDKINYQVIGEGNQLFIVSFEKVSTQSYSNGTYEHKFNLNISINRDCALYKDRYNEEIYGKYILYIQASSNSAKSRTIEIDFEKTGVTSIVIDNYTSLEENMYSLSTSSDLAYPGVSGLLSLTINPEDSDFDYIVIENDEHNFDNGRANATFGLLARRENQYVDESNKVPIFDDNIIVGSIVANGGLKLTLEELITAYNKDQFVKYNGVIYLKYDVSSNNVIDLSISKIKVSVYKDNEVVYSSSKELSVKLQNYVAVEIDGKKEIATNQNNFYKTYEVARGLKYKLNLNTYGFRQDSIQITSNNSIGRVSYENGSYYLTISEGNIDYNDSNNEVILTTTAAQQDGETVRTAESQTKIIVYEYVINYNNETDKNSDIVNGMGDGVINIQVGTQITFALNINEFIEYSSSISGVVNKINEFVNSLERVGTWKTITNLISDDQPDYKMADPNSDRLKYQIGYNDAGLISGKNYYFNYNGLSVIPKRTHLPEEKFYYFDFSVCFDVENGVYSAKPITENNINSFRKIETTFMLNVYSTSSAESPIPIYNYTDFIKMQSGGYYILLNDITLPSTDDGDIKAFTPLVGNFASFDGNGHAINFAGTYDMGSLSSIGLFSSLSENSIIKNLVVNYTSSNDGNDLNTDANDTIYGLNGLRTVKFITTADNFVFGSIVAENLGIITNCQVFTNTVAGNRYYLTVKADNALTSDSYVGGLVGYNNGYITNCGVSINAKVPFYLAGVVAQNYNKIAGCYFKEGQLINNSQYDQHIAGFTISNSENAQIITSFVSGAQSNTSLYSKDNNSQIASTLAGGGFIYDNAGTIKDCYTDINLQRTSSEMAGFAYRNSGRIRNSFSLSILRSNTTASAGFAKENSINGVVGSFENCYYFYNLKNGNVDDGHDIHEDNINVSLYDVSYEGVERLTKGQFADVDNYFENYSYDKNVSAKSVWFFSQGHQSSDFVEYIPTTEKIVLPGEDGNDQSNTIYNTQLITFGLNRLALVAPNTRVLSVRNFDRSEIDDETGNVTYFYLDDANAPDRGSIHNPRLIYDSQTMEQEILNQTANNNVNTTNYRIISDISYVTFEGHSQLYKVTFAGNLEGNGMEISAIGLVYMDSRTNGGLFSQIGYSASRIGSVKNLTLSPKEVVFNNTNNVGALAGTLKYGYIYDIKIDANSNNLSTISGLNFVGGVIGKAANAFEAKDIYSNADIWAVYSPGEDVTYTENSGQETNCSYAGGLFGFVGNGSIFNAHVEGITSISGSRTGLAYGGIGSGAMVQYTFASVDSDLALRANHYAGYIVGENSGTLKYAYVSDNGNTATSFTTIPKAAVGVGGIAGKFSGGLISNALIEQSFRISSADNENVIENVGGLVGLVTANNGILSTLEDCVVNADITAGANLGGAVGTISSALEIDGVAVKSDILTLKGKRVDPKLGGIVGNISGDTYAALDMKNSYCTADLFIETFTTGVSSQANVGGLIGYSKIVPSLAYCYTTSHISAEVYDARALGVNEDFASTTSENSKFTYNSISGNSQNNDYERVYYWGASTSGNSDAESNGSDIYTKNKVMVDFKTRSKDVLIGLVVNNFGKSSTEYMSELSSTNMENSTNKNSLYNLFGNKYQIKTKLEGTLKDVNNDNLKIGTELYYNTFTNSFVTGSNGIVFVANPDKEETYLYYPNSQDKDKYYELEVSQNLLHRIFYKGEDGEYYKLSINNSGEIGYYKMDNSTFIKEENMNVSLKQVWRTSYDAFSTLYIEESFDWLNMK